VLLLNLINQYSNRRPVSSKVLRCQQFTIAPYIYAKSIVEVGGFNQLKYIMDMHVEWSNKGAVNTQTKYVIISSLIFMICLFRDSPGLLKKLSVNGDRRFLVS